ncbi:MAG: TetR/AcrR family transcriptional regulator [Solirubrobacterales bacterium]
MAQLPQSLSKAPVGRTRLSREALTEHQRERILTHATEVFAKRGFTATTVDNIVAAANIGVGSFYAHFEGKGECLLAVCDRISREVHAQISAAMPADGDWAERALAGLHAFLAFTAAEPLAARVILIEAQTGGPEALAHYGEELERLAGFLREGRAAAKLDPKTPASFEEAAASGLAWLLQGRLVRGEADDVDSLFEEMAEVALEPYLGAQQSKARIRAFRSPASPG